MANTYGRKISKIFRQPVFQEGDLSLGDVVTRIEYMYHGTSEHGTEVTEGPFTFYPDKPTTSEGYIQFNELTEAQASAWLPEDSNIDEIHADLDRKIAEIETPTYAWAELPWDRPPLLPSDPPGEETESGE